VGLAVCYLVQYLVTAHRLLFKLKQESTHDFLTGLNNTRQFDIKYNQMLSSAILNKHKVSLLIIDIDHFKEVNDMYGHIAGDEVLKELGQVLLKSCRNIDLVSRIGGEEFAVVLENLSIANTMEIAERVRSSVESNTFTLSGGKQLKITVSVGAAVYPDTIDDIGKLKEEADTKLYEAKHNGRNKTCI
jgi:diguanylate cyclase